MNKSVISNRKSQIVNLLLYLLFCFTINVSAQEVRKIQIISAGYIDYDEEKLGKEIKRLGGGVVIGHEGAVMYCDSAYLNTDRNDVIAYNNVHIVQGDTLHLYGDIIRYDGNTKIAKVRNHVKMINDESVLTTDSMNYDRKTNVGYYFSKGKITDRDNILTSEKGYYYAKLKDFFAIDTVVLINPEYKMYSDTLKYNIASEVASFYGPTDIIGDSTTIYCENGWYNTKTDISQYNKHAVLTHKNQILKGDSLYYDNKNGFGKAFINVIITDTVEKITLKGNYANYFREPEKAMMTDSAVLIQAIDTDTLYLHSDTIFYYGDTTAKNHLIKAYYKVKIFKSDIQSKCDSLVYIFKDSLFQFYYNPVIWSDKNQITADYIEIHTKNQKLDFILLEEAAFIVSQEDTIRFNQVKGKNMVGYFNDSGLYRVDVNGNAQATYFPKDKDDLIGVNTSESSNMIIYLDDKDVKKILFLNKPNSILHPLNELSPEELLLKNFKWLENIRPLDKFDIFN